MFAFDRETATIVAVVVCVAATIYLFRELKKTKEELSTAIAKKQQPVVYMEPPRISGVPVSDPTPDTSPEPAPVPVPDKVVTTRKKHVTITEPESNK